MKPEINHVIDAGSPDKNEDYIWIGPEDGVKAILVLDGTSGTAGDFGSKNSKTGGKRYVEEFGEALKDIIVSGPEENLEKVVKEAISRTWGAFEEQGAETAARYLEGEDVAYPKSETVPGAVGCLIRWSGDELEVMHVGDVETYVVKQDETDFYSNATHEAFDAKLNDAIEKEGKGSNKAEKLVSEHRSASNFPGTYPQIGFNPLAVENLGEKENYNMKDVDRVVISTDGGSTRIKKLFDMDNQEVLKFIDENGVEKALEKLREKEDKTEIAELKQSDDAAIVDLRF